jgi:hypothetical protein
MEFQLELTQLTWSLPRRWPRWRGMTLHINWVNAKWKKNRKCQQIQDWNWKKYSKPYSLAHANVPLMKAICQCKAARVKFLRWSCRIRVENIWRSWRWHDRLACFHLSVTAQTGLSASHGGEVERYIRVFLYFYREYKRSPTQKSWLK